MIRCALYTSTADIAMSGLLTLSPELLVQVFTASETIRDALRLSATTRHLRAVWLEHSVQIIEGVLKPSIPAYDEAVALTVLETRVQSSPEHDPTLRLCLPALLRNADLCASVCLGHSLAREDKPSPPASYYFLRRLALAFDHHQLRDDFYHEIRGMSRDALSICCNISHWLLGDASLAEQIRQGVEAEDYDHIRDMYNERDNKWDYADHVVYVAIGDIDFGTNNLPTVIQGYDI